MEQTNTANERWFTENKGTLQVPQWTFLQRGAYAVVIDRRVDRWLSPRDGETREQLEEYVRKRSGPDVYVGFVPISGDTSLCY